MNQEKMTMALCEMLGCSICGLWCSDGAGKHELAEIIRQLADVVESDSPNLGNIFSNLAAWNQAKLVCLGGMK